MTFSVLGRDTEESAMLPKTFAPISVMPSSITTSFMHAMRGASKSGAADSVPVPEMVSTPVAMSKEYVAFAPQVPV